MPAPPDSCNLDAFCHGSAYSSVALAQPGGQFDFVGKWPVMATSETSYLL
jgi:hypothetical protein